MKNKVLAMLLALCMVMSLLPVTVFAEATKPSTQAPCTCGCTNSECTSCSKAENADTWTCECTSAQGQTPGKGCGGNCKYKACGVEGCADKNTILDSTAHTEHTFTCVCEGCDGAEGKTCCVQNNQAGTYTAAAKSENGLCENCVAVGGGTGDDDDTPIYCSCTSNDCHSATHTRGEEQVKGCANEVEEDGVCRTCQLSIEATQAAAAAATRDCDKDDNAQGSENCKNKEHTSQCPMACGKGGCTLTKNHTGDHKNTECINDKGCAKTLGDGKAHVANCPSYELKKADAGKDNAIGSKDVEVTITCACSKKDSHDKDGKHDAEDEGKCDDEALKRTVTVKFYYEWETVDGDKKPLDADAIAEKKAKAEKDAADAAATEAKAKELLTDDQKVCDYCAAANKAAEEAKAAEDLAKCTMAVTCKADKHHDDCLSQCTMDSYCGNTVGDSAAHRIQYQVYKTTYEVTLDGQRVTKRVNKGTVADGPAYDELKDAQDYRLGLPANNGDPDQNNKQVRYGYSIRAIHCPQAKVPDGVVVSIDADGTVAETPAETPEKPTKAEEFTDMEDWMAEGVQYMLDKGWMEGMGDGKFGGRDDLKTTMVLTVLARMNGETITGSTWADDAKAWAEKNAEFFEGIDLTSENMARKDVVLVLWRQAGKPEPSADFELEFTDVEGLEGDHLTAMKWAVENKIVLGNGDGTVSPDGNINRSALSLLTMRADKASSK